MKKSYISILLLAMVMILAISAVSAAEDIDTSDSDLQAVDEAPVEEVASEDVDAVAATDDADVVADPGDGNNFTSLQYIVDNPPITGNIVLDRDYTRVADDEDISISGRTTIIGDGHKIDANNLGGIFKIKTGGVLTLMGVTLVNGNSENGGAILNDGILVLSGCSFINNTASANGGAIYNNATIDYFLSNTFENNKATKSGGAIYTVNDLKMDKSEFTGNTAYQSGGAVYANDCQLTVDETSFKSNKVSDFNNAYGGAIFLDTDSSLILTTCIFENNEADLLKSSQGGAIFSQARCNITISDSRFTDNAANRKGGAIYIASQCDLSVVNSNFTGNKATFAGSNGGAISGYTNSVMSIEGSEFTDNSAANGGAIHLDRVNADINGAKFIGNNATKEGGALYAFNQGKVVSVENSTFEDNTNNGVANSILLSLGDLELSGNTIAGDESEIFVKSGKLTSDIIVDILNGANVTTYDGAYMVNATVTDDNGNPVTIAKGLTFVTEGAQVAAVYNATTKVYEGLLALPAPGIFTVNITYVSDDKLVVKTATIKNFKGTFQDLADKVANANGNLNLTYDFAYTPELGDTPYVNGVVVNKDLTINGNNHTIDGNDGARIFITYATLTLNDIIFKNGKADKGGAIYAVGTLNVNNCTFINNTATSEGNAIYIADLPYRVYIIDSEASYDAVLAIENGPLQKYYAANPTEDVDTSDPRGHSWTAVQNAGLKTDVSELPWIVIDMDEPFTGDINVDYNGTHVFGPWHVSNKTYGIISVTNPGDCGMKQFALWGNTAQYATGEVLDTAAFISYLDDVLISSATPADKSTFIKDSTFTDNGASNDYAIYNLGKLALENNIISNLIYNEGELASTINITVMGNETHNFSYKGINLTATITDDNGNVIVISDINFIVGTVEVPTVYDYETNLYVAEYIPTSEGKFVVTMNTTYPVNTALISFTRSLIDIQNMVNAAQDGDVINLTGDYAYIEEFDKEIINGIVIDKNITIDGKGYTISGSNAARIFNVTSGTLALANVTLTKGKADEGSAVLVASGAELDADYVTFVDNTADLAGAISNYGNVNIDHSVFDSNDVVSRDYGAAAIYNEGTVIINNTEIKNNLKTKANRTAGDYMLGAVYSSGTLKVYNSNFTNNSGTHGGAISTSMNPAASLLATCVVDNCRFIDNSAYTGAAIYAAGRVKLDVNNSYFENNVASEYGSVGYSASAGAISIIGLTSPVTIDNSVFKKNKAFNGALPNGGAIAIENSAVNIDSCTFEDNFAELGGAIASGAGSTLSVTRSNFTGNDAANGSAIYSNGQLTLSGNKVFSDKTEIVVGPRGTITSKINIVVLDGKNWTTNKFEVKLNATVKDDKGNYIKDAGFNFTIDGKSDIKAVYNDVTQTYEAEYTLSAPGIYLVNVTYITDNELVVETYNITCTRGTFTDLFENYIKGKDSANLTYNFTYFEDLDAGYINGIVIDHNVNIDGNGYTISGNDAARIFDVTAGTLALSNVTLTKGNCSVLFAEGGAIIVKSGATLKADYVTFTDNVADFGGAISNYGTLNIDNSVFNGNDIRVRDDTYRAYGIGNTGGSAIYNEGGIVNINNTVFDDNLKVKANRTNGDLLIGSIYSYNGNIYVYNSNFTDNSGVYGGAMEIVSPNVSTEAIIDNCRFINNTAYNGAAIYVLQKVKLDVNNSYFENNVASEYGSTGASSAAGAIGVVGVTGPVTIYNSTFKENKAVDGALPNGGAIAIENSAVNIDSCTFEDNSAELGGAIASGAGSTLSVTRSNFTGNDAANGSAIYSNGKLTLSGNKINSTATEIVVGPNGTVISKMNATILENKTWNDTGLGDIYILNATLTDDRGNSIYDPSFRFTVDGTPIDDVLYDETTGLYTVGYYMETAGNKVVSTNYTADNLDIFTGALYIELANVTEFTVTVADVLEDDNATVVVTLVGVNNQTLNATVTVIINNKPINVTVTNGTGSEVVENLTHGQYPVVAMLNNLPNYNDAINSTVFYVKGQSKLTIANLTTAVYGDVIEVIINLTDADGNPLNGTVVINETIQVLVENGIGKFVTIEGSNPDVGEYYFNAAYEGTDDLFGYLTDFTVNVTAKEINNSDVIVGISGDAPDNVTVYIEGPDAVYNVTVDDQTVQVDVVNGTGTADISGLDVGNKTAVITIDSDNYKMDPITKEFPYFRYANLTATVINPTIDYEENATVSVSIDADATGNITVYDNGELWYEFSVEEARNGIEIPLLTAGDHSIRLVYSGDDKFAPDYDVVYVSVEKIAPAIEVNVTENAKFGDKVTLNVSVSIYGDGNVSIIVDGKEIFRNETDHGGLASADVNFELAVGEHTYIVTFEGTDNYLSNQAIGTFNVDKKDPEISIVVENINNLSAIAYTKLTVTVADGNATGRILIEGLDSNIYAELTDGSYILDPLVLLAGDYNITVTYYGEDRYTNASDYVVFAVAKGAATPVITNVTGEILGGQNATFTVTMSDDHAYGNVTIFVDGIFNQVVVLGDEYPNATVTISGLNNGTHTIDVQYNGNDDYEAVANATVKISVSLAPSKVTIAPIADSYDGSAVITYTIDNETGALNITIIDLNDPNKEISFVNFEGTVNVTGLAAGKYCILVENLENNYYAYSNDTAIFNVYDNVVTNDTFFAYFDESGYLRDVVPFDELIFKGSFSDLGIDVITIDRYVSITGKDKSLNALIGMGLRILADDVEVSNLFIINNATDFRATNNCSAVYVKAEDVTFDTVIVIYNAPKDADAHGIYVTDSEGFRLYDSYVIFSGDENNTNYQYGVGISDSDDVCIDNTKFTIRLPARSVNWAGTGINQDLVLAVGIQNGEGIAFTNNIVDVKVIGETSGTTLDAIMVYDVTDLEISNNNITLTDAENIGVAYYQVVDLYSFDGIVSNNNIIVNTTTGVPGSGTAYPIQLNGPYTAIVSNNNLTSISNGPSAGIYTYNWAGYADLTVTENNINVVGSGEPGQYGAATTGMELQVHNALVYDNTITVESIEEYNETLNVFGISNVQDATVEHLEIMDNTVSTTGKYAVIITTAKDSTVTDNYLIAHELYGDDAVEAGENATVEANYPQDLDLIVYAEDIYVNDPVEIFVSTNPLFSGNVSVIFNGESIQVEIIDGEGSTGLLSSVPASTYTVNATYDGNYYFMPDNDCSNFTVYKYASNMTITVGDVVVDQDLEVNISLPFADGNVTIVLDDGTLATVELVDGEGNYTITKNHMTAGNHSITVSLSGNPEYVDVSEIYNFTVEKAENYTFEVNLTVDEINYGENTTINVTLPEDANGIIIVSVDGEIVTFEDVVNGTASVTIPADAFTAGDFNEIEVTYSDDKYGETTKVTDIFVNKLPSDLTATADDIELGQNATVVIKLPTYTDGDVYVELLGEVYYPVEWKVIFENLTEGTYTVYVYLEDDSIFEDNMTSVTFNVTKVVIPPEDAFNFTTPENSTSEVISVELPDDATGFLLLDINGTQTHVPLVDGKANVTVPLLPEGTYNATITYTGDDKYAPISTTKELNVTSNVPDNALSIPDSAKSDAPTTYSISLPEDATGYLEVDVDGTKYAAPLNKGSASVTIPALSAGNHNVTVTYTGDNKYSPVVKSTSLSVTAPVFKITNNKNVAAVYSAKATYKVLVTRDGKAVGAGQAVTFKYNGKTYTVKTDSKGYATFKPSTKVKVKKYTVTATYKGVTVKNTVTIKHVLKVKNAKIKKSKKVNKIKVKTKKVNGKYLKGKKLTLKIKGKKVKAKINKKGVATFKLKKSITKKLKAGKKYKFTVTYGKDKVTKKAKVKK